VGELVFTRRKDLDPDDVQQWEGFWPTPDEPVKIVDE
jgi:hypothetical protein